MAHSFSWSSAPASHLVVSPLLESCRYVFTQFSPTPLYSGTSIAPYAINFKYYNMHSPEILLIHSLHSKVTHLMIHSAF